MLSYLSFFLSQSDYLPVTLSQAHHANKYTLSQPQWCSYRRVSLESLTAGQPESAAIPSSNKDEKQENNTFAQSSLSQQ